MQYTLIQIRVHRICVHTPIQTQYRYEFTCPLCRYKSTDINTISIITQFFTIQINPTKWENPGRKREHSPKIFGIHHKSRNSKYQREYAFKYIIKYII